MIMIITIIAIIPAARRGAMRGALRGAMRGAMRGARVAMRGARVAMRGARVAMRGARCTVHGAQRAAHSAQNRKVQHCTAQSSIIESRRVGVRACRNQGTVRAASGKRKVDSASLRQAVRQNTYND